MASKVSKRNQAPARWAVVPRANPRVISKRTETRDQARDWRNSQRNPEAYKVVDTQA